MLTGHFGFAAAAKAVEPRLPTWSYMLATQWLDVVFVPLFVVGIETMEPLAGTDGGYADAVIHADWTHSLLGALLLSALLAVVSARRWGRNAGLLLGAVSMSHWLLDLVMHHADLPLLPGNAADLPLLGLGLWDSHAASMVAEMALLVVGGALYLRAARRAGATGRRVIALTAVFTVGAVGTLGFDVLGL